MKKVFFNALVRDKMPAFLESKECIVHKTILNDEAFGRALRAKLVEECSEVRLALSKDELIEELADLQEVIEVLLQLHAIQKSDIEMVQLKKREAKGGFEGRVFVSEINFEDENPIAQYYQKNSEKYKIQE